MLYVKPKSKEELLEMILFQDENLVRIFNRMRSKGKSLRTLNSRELALFTDSLKDLKRILFLYNKRDKDVNKKCD